MNQTTHMRRISLTVLALVATLLVAVPQPAAALSTYLNVDQLDVNTFVDAGNAVAQRSFTPEDTDAVVLATDSNFPDGLTASAVAAAVGGPVLFTRVLELPASTEAEIDRLLEPGDTVYIMGGTVAVSPAVENQLDDDYTVVRLAGSTRLETAVEAAELVGVDAADPRVIIARAFGPEGANTTSDRTTGWVDAISCGAYAAAAGIPILLTETDVLSSTTEAALRDLDPDEAIVCGGVAAVSADTVEEIEDLGINTERIEGPTRVETAIDAARTLFDATSARAGAFVVVPGYGENFGYGLAAAPLGLPILLVGTFEPTLCTDGSQPSRETLCYLRTAGDDTAQLIVVGNEDVISDPVVDALGAAAGGRDLADLPLLAAPSNVTAADETNDDGTRATVSWNTVADPDEILAGYQVFVDGQPAPGETATVGPDTTTVLLDGLTPEEEASITVAAIDVGDREGAMSSPALVTPEDEVPEALEDLQAAAGDTVVTLTWTRGPVDAASYSIERATAQLVVGCLTYSEVEEVTDPDTTTFVDEGLTNGTEYCYRISVTDEAGQTSPTTDAEPVTPNVGVPQVTLTSPERDSGAQSRPDLFFGQSTVVQYRVTDTNTPANQLRATWQISYDAGTNYTTVSGGDNVPITFTPAGNGSATFAVPSCQTATGPVDDVPADSTSRDCIRDQGINTVRLRVTVTDGTNATRVRTDNLELVRRPGPVEGLGGVPGAGQVTLVWDRLANITVTDYLVRRAEVVREPDSDAGAEVCPADTAVVYEEIAEVDQPASGAQVSLLDGNLRNDDGTPFENDIIYCYLVQARRAGVNRGETTLAAANPDEALQGSIVLREPSNGAVVRSGSQQVLRYDIDLPDGVTADGVRFEYCRDFRQALTNTRPQCQDTGGFTSIPQDQLSGTPSAAEGSRQVTWRVPQISQPDSATEGGAIQVFLTRQNSSGGTDQIASNRVVEITFT